jgi:hypothetical protein
LDNIIKEFLKEGSDFGTIPGTKKPTLYKSGAEKLMKVFNLGVGYTVVDKIEDFLKEWEFDIPEYKYVNGKRVFKGLIRTTTRGFYHYRVRADLTHIHSGNPVGSCEGSCDSTEQGRETVPGNTVLKMAQKRALLGAILNATFSSDRFTQDVEDYGDTQKQASHGAGAAASVDDKEICSWARLARKT